MEVKSLMKMSNDFPTILNCYFSKHLKLERRFSSNTYISYLTVLKQYIHFLNSELNISNKKISMTDFEKNNIISFLNYAETTLKVSPRTRNHKLTVLNSFLEYAQSINPVYIELYLASKSIKLKRVKKEKMDFMTVEELKAFFECIDLKHKTGYKHYVMLTTLYETATRVSELINIQTTDLFFSENPYIKIVGKGNKERIVYINDSVVSMIKEYRKKFNISNGYLFLNNSGNQFTRYGVNKIVKNYFEQAKQKCQTLRSKTITPHSFRHTKAVHFLQNGTALPIIQRFLGHSNIQTTEIYLDITKSVVIEAVKLSANIITSSNEKALWAGDEDLISLLESLSN